MNRFNSKSDYKDSLAYRMPSTPLLETAKKPKGKVVRIKTTNKKVKNPMQSAYNSASTYGLGVGH